MSQRKAKGLTPEEAALVDREIIAVRIMLVERGKSLLRQPFIRETYPWINSEMHSWAQSELRRFEEIGLPAVVCPWCGDVYAMPETFPNEPLECSTGD